MYSLGSAPSADKTSKICYNNNNNQTKTLDKANSCLPISFRAFYDFPALPSSNVDSYTHILIRGCPYAP